ncbi:MAG: hypothetical protein V4722_14465 [Bacteroidota bacterium]
MKNILLVLLTLLVFSCKKSVTTEIPTEAHGNWELRGEHCGWSLPRSHPVGNGAIIKINTDGTYQSSFGGTYSGSYTITQRVNASQQKQWYIYFDGNWKHEYRLTLDNGKFSIDNADVIADGCGYMFERY